MFSLCWVYSEIEQKVDQLTEMIAELTRRLQVERDVGLPRV